MAIYCIGDIHGKFDKLADKVRQLAPYSHLICVGDIGLGFGDSAGPECLRHVDEAAAEMEINIWMIRGNHDNPYVFRGQQKKWNDSFTNINLMSDVDSMEIEGRHVIFVGGAISVDRSHEGRVDGHSWWKEEPVHESSPSRVYKIVEEFGPADLLVTHAGPITTLPVIDEFDPNVYYYTTEDPHLLHDINVERTRLSDCVQYSRAPAVVYGHYHVPLEYHNTGVDYRCVAELEIWEFRHRRTAHLPQASITDEEKAKVETAPIRLKAPKSPSKLTLKPLKNVAGSNTEDATTEELVAKTEHLRKTSKHTLISGASLPSSPPMKRFQTDNSESNNGLDTNNLPPA